MKKDNFYNNMWKIALPVTIQCMFQASLSLIDQIMIGHLGSANIAGVGLGAKFISLFSVTVSAIITVAGILISQYKGTNDDKGISTSFSFNMNSALLVTIIFSVLSLAFSKQIMSLYTSKADTISAAATYLKIMTIGFVPMTLTLMFSVLMRNSGCADVPMYASLISVILNTLLNYCLIYGPGFFPKLNLVGAALATSIARIIEFIIVFTLYLKKKSKYNMHIKYTFRFSGTFAKSALIIISPIILNEFLWSLGENVYAGIYGHIGTDPCAAMTLTFPLQTLVIGALTGVSNASGILVGNSLGKSDYDKAYSESKRFIKITLSVAIVFSLFIAFFGRFYVKLFNVTPSVQTTTIYILYAYALVFTAKVLNMVVAGGILRSGGKTKYTLFLDLIGTWGIGVPIGIITSRLLNMPIYYVYFFLSLEEYVRLILGIIIFRSKKWMQNLTD